MVLRLAWLIVGNVVLLALALLIAQSGGFSGYDLAYWVTIAGVVLSRWFDVTRFGGLTKDGAPATRRDWSRHALLLTVLGAAVWGGIHFVSGSFGP